MPGYPHLRIRCRYKHASEYPIYKIEKRPKKEINFLFKLIKDYFKKEIENIINQGIRINIIGDLKKLSPEIKSTLIKTINLTKHNKKVFVNLAINYGSKNEILNSAKKTN